jgi:hypothetical protein
MRRKSFPLATFVRHSIPILPNNYYSFPAGIKEYQIAIGKGFPAHTPVTNRIFRVFGIELFCPILQDMREENDEKPAQVSSISVL